MTDKVIYKVSNKYITNKNITDIVICVMDFTLQPVTGKQLIGRDEIVDEIVKNLEKGGWGYALYGIRRIGKTSILLEVRDRINKGSRAKAIYIDVWNYPLYQVKHFMLDLTHEILESYKTELGVKAKISSLISGRLDDAKNIISELEIGVKATDILKAYAKLRLNPPEDVNETIDHCFKIAEDTAAQTKKQCVIIIDEFPTLQEYKMEESKAGIRLIRKLRAVTQNLKHVEVVISGSIKSTMATVALDNTAPFYRQLKNIEIKPLTPTDTGEVMTQVLGGISKEAKTKMHSITGGIPFYIHSIGRELKTKKPKSPDIQEGLEKLLDEEGSILFTSQFRNLSDIERQILITMSKQEDTPMKTIREKINKPSDYTTTYLQYLMEKGHITRKTKGIYKYTDPVFKMWVKEKYSQQ